MIRPNCISIAGSDSGGEAGCQADLQAFADFDTHGSCAITAVTAQNPNSLFSVNPVHKQVLDEQISTLLKFFPDPYFKSGLMPRCEHIETAAALLGNTPLIADPVMISTSGSQIMNTKTRLYYCKTLLPKACVITPNYPEAEIISGLPINTPNNARAAIQKMADTYQSAIYLKGGHSSKPGIDLFYDGNELYELSVNTLNIRSSHGTGCRLSAALCAALACGYDMPKAAQLAKNYVFHSLQSCRQISTEQWVMASPGTAKNLTMDVKIKKL